MPRNTRGGNKAKRGKNVRKDDDDKKTPVAEGGQVYAKVKSRLGGNRIDVECSDNKSRSAVIRGKMIKRVWIYPGDILLVDTEGMGQEDVCTINYKYNKKEIRELKQKGLITFEDDGTELAFDEENVVVEEKAPVKSDNWMDDMMPPSDSEDEEYNGYMNSYFNEKKNKETEKTLKGKKRVSNFTKSDEDESSESGEFDLDDL